MIKLNSVWVRKGITDKRLVYMIIKSIDNDVYYRNIIVVDEEESKIMIYKKDDIYESELMNLIDDKKYSEASNKMKQNIIYKVLENTGIEYRR